MSGSGEQSVPRPRSARPIELHQWRLFVARPAGHRASLHALGIDAEHNAVRVTSRIVSVDPDAWLCRTRTRGYRMLGQPLNEERAALGEALNRWRERHTPFVEFFGGAARANRKELLAAAAAFLSSNRPVTRGRDVVGALLESGELVPSAEAARRVGRTEEELARQTHRLFSLATPQGPAYPAFLFDDALIRRGLGEVLVSLSATDPWTKWLFLTGPSAALGGGSPLEALRSGEPQAVKTVLRLARAKARRKR